EPASNLDRERKGESAPAGARGDQADAERLKVRLGEAVFLATIPKSFGKTLTRSVLWFLPCPSYAVRAAGPLIRGAPSRASTIPTARSRSGAGSLGEFPMGPREIFRERASWIAGVR